MPAIPTRGGDPPEPPAGPLPNSLFTRIDHVGIACRGLARAVAFYESAFGMVLAHQEENTEQGVAEAIMRLPGAARGAAYVQLLEPLGPDTPVGRFLDRRGEGIHHVGYGVTDITSALASIAGTGVRLLDARPRHGSMGASIAFLHPADIGGVLTELVQAAPTNLDV